MSRRTRGTLRRAVPMGCGGLVLLVAPLVLLKLSPRLFDGWLARRDSMLQPIGVHDARGARVGRAVLTFQDADGQIVAVADLVNASQLRRVPERRRDWGRRVVQARVQAFGCDLAVATRVELQRTGSYLGGFAPHPVPRTVTWHVGLEPAVCPPPAPGASGLPLSFLLAELEGEPSHLASGSFAELARLGPLAVETVPLLMRKLAPENPPHLRAAAIRVLAAIGPPADDSLQLLLELLQHDPDRLLRRSAAVALDAIARGRPEVAAALAATAARDPDLDNRRRFLRLLGEQGAAARAQTGALSALVRDANEPLALRHDALYTLRRVAPAEQETELRSWYADLGVLW